MHASLIQRRKYQIDTSKIYYQFRNSDLESSVKLIANLGGKASLAELNQMVYRGIYGGAVGDHNDLRLLAALTKNTFQECTHEGQLTLFGRFTPPTTSLKDLKAYVATLPDKDDASMFGFSDGEEQIYCRRKEA